MKKRFIASLSLSLLVALGTMPAGVAQGNASRLDAVKRRGKLVCGVNQTLPGFGFLETNGSYSGFDTEFCRAVAVAVLNDPTKVEFVPLTAAARFTAVQSGEVDVVFRNTTVTASRDGENGMDFLPVTFYDGQAVMVKSDAPVRAITDLAGATICAIQGTTTEQNITDYMKLKKKAFKLQTFADLEKVLAAFVGGRCDAMTSDSSQLAAARASQPKPDAFKILSERISKEPLAGFVAQNDSRWRDVCAWVIYATIYAEELKITKANIDSFKNSADPSVRRFLGAEGTIGKGLGLTADFAVDVVKAVGNYSEIYNKYFGPNSKLQIPRGINRLYTAGGLLYAPPFR